MKQDSNTLTTREKANKWFNNLDGQLKYDYRATYLMGKYDMTDEMIEEIYLAAHPKERIKHPEQSLPSKEVDILDKFINEIKQEFKNENWDYLPFIAERVRNQNESSKEETIKEENTRLKERIEVLEGAFGNIIEYTFAFESDFEKCLTHIRKLSHEALNNK